MRTATQHAKPARRRLGGHQGGVLTGKVALVTGGARRIGRSICAALVAEGCRVVVHYNQSGSEAEALVKTLSTPGARCGTVRGDLQHGEDCANVITQTVKLTGRLDILINNAAVFSRQPLTQLTDEALYRILDVNLLAPMLLSREFARRVRKGKIVNMLDCRISGTDPGSMAYALSKKSLADFTRLAARELAPGITVNGVAPGALLPPTATSAVRERAGRQPLARRPTLAELTHAIMFLLTADSVTGQIVYVDSGQHLLGAVDR